MAGLGEGTAIDKDELKWVIICAYLRLPTSLRVCVVGRKLACSTVNNSPVPASHVARQLNARHSSLMLLASYKYCTRSPTPFKLLRLRPRPSSHFSHPNMDSLKAKMTSLTPFQRKHKVTVVGSGNWYEQ